MKKTMTMIVFILALGSQAIAGGLSELKIRTNANVSLKVIIDGQVVSHNTSMVEVNSIPFGKHKVQVFQVIKSYNGYQQHALFSGEIYLPQNTVTHALIKHHKFIIEEQFALYTKPNYKKPHHTGYGNYYDTKPITWQTQAHNVRPNVGLQHHGHYSEPIPEVVYPMSAQDFNHLKSAIENQWFSDEKKIVLRQALADDHLLTISQVKNLIELFNFSGDRLEVAKMAYVNTVDRENYFQVYNSLRYNSSVQNLSNYIASL
jgi:hypothetical protein